MAKGQQLYYSMLWWGGRPLTQYCIRVYGPSLISESGCVAPAQLLHGPPTQHHIGPCLIAAWVFKAAQGRMAPSHHGAHQGALPHST